MRAAAAIYAECDGLEFEKSACKFDLRFVPDEQSFEGRKVCMGEGRGREGTSLVRVGL